MQIGVFKLLPHLHLLRMVKYSMTSQNNFEKCVEMVGFTVQGIWMFTSNCKGKLRMGKNDISFVAMIFVQLSSSVIFAGVSWLVITEVMRCFSSVWCHICLSYCMVTCQSA